MNKLKLKNNDTTPNHTAVIGGVFGGSFGVAVAVIVLVFVLRRKYSLNLSCNMSLSRKEDVRSGPKGHCDDNAAVTNEVVTATKGIAVYSALNEGNDGPDNSHLYTPLDESTPESHVYYGNVKKEDPVYNNTVMKIPVQTVL